MQMDGNMTDFNSDGLSNKPSSPMPWRLQDNVIFDATGESILGSENGNPIGFPCEFDADFIYQAAMQFVTKGTS